MQEMENKIKMNMKEIITYLPKLINKYLFEINAMLIKIGITPK